MTQSIPLATLPGRVPNAGNGNQRSDGTTQDKTQCFCPDNWIGFRDNCYYFSKEENDWNSSRSNCASQHAYLTAIDTKEEMNFLKQYKCTSDHWIGLTMTKNQTGRWVNETMFNKWFDVKGNEECAYLGDDGVATARCYTERKWICRKEKKH